jgi:methylmalonyl-CoA mutase cobalamin-binding subunit
MYGWVWQGYMNKEEETTDDIIIVSVRELSYEDTKKEVMKYLENAGKRKVYVSEIINS